MDLSGQILYDYKDYPQKFQSNGKDVLITKTSLFTRKKKRVFGISVLITRTSLHTRSL